MTTNGENQIDCEISIREFFKDSVCTAIANQKLSISDEVILYIVNLLMSFTRTDRLYNRTEEGYVVKPLAMIYAETLEASSVTEKNKSLQLLGDFALFISGLFSSSLSRSLVDVDYYITMGGNAYSHLADSTRNSFQGHVISMMFEELSEKFIFLVDVLGEMSENTPISSDGDILRIYEIWLKTGSKRIARKLQQLGLQPIHVSSTPH